MRHSRSLGPLPLSFLLLLVLSLSIYVSPAFGAVLAIDYGTDFMKASLMKPGIPFDVLLNKDSKRKIQSSVAWKGEERLFGSDAYNLVSLGFTVRGGCPFLLPFGFPFLCAAMRRRWRLEEASSLSIGRYGDPPRVAFVAGGSRVASRFR